MSFQFRSYSNYEQLIKAALYHAAHFVGKTFSSLCSRVTASTKLSSEIFAVRHSPYAVSKFELRRPSERGENGWEHFYDEE